MPLNKTILYPYKRKIFVETGTYLGEGINTALEAGFEKIYSIEIDDYYFKRCLEKFRNNEKVNLIKGDSKEELPKLLKQIQEPATIWLDAHTDFDTPIMDELKVLQQCPIKNHIILIDDVRNLKNLYKNIEFNNIINEIKKINPDYNISFIDSTYCANDILVAQEKNKIVILSSYTDKPSCLGNVMPEEAVTTQRRIIEHFTPEGCDFIQGITEPMEAPIPILHNFIKNTDYEIYIFFDIDAIPLNKEIIPRMIKEAKAGKLIGCIGRNGSSHYFIPHCGMAFSKETYEKCGVDFSKGKRYLNPEEFENEMKIFPKGINIDEQGKWVQIDVAEKITFKCEELGIPIVFLPVTHIEKVEWRWLDGFELGYGVTFENAIWHQCETWRGMDRFFRKCKEVEEEIKNGRI